MRRRSRGWTSSKIFPPSDGLIDEWSAHALTGPLVRHIVDTDVHAWDPAPVPFNITSYLYPAQTYDRFIRNALRDPDCSSDRFRRTAGRTDRAAQHHAVECRFTAHGRNDHPVTS